ncbi:MAG: hypothetical protein WCA35_06670 [Kovacikia sp.]
MKNVQKNNNQLTLALSRVTLEQLQQAAHEGFKSVINLRSQRGESFLRNE